MSRSRLIRESPWKKLLMFAVFLAVGVLTAATVRWMFEVKGFSLQHPDAIHTVIYKGYVTNQGLWAGIWTFGFGVSFALIYGGRLWTAEVRAIQAVILGIFLLNIWFYAADYGTVLEWFGEICMLILFGIGQAVIFFTTFLKYLPEPKEFLITSLCFIPLGMLLGLAVRGVIEIMLDSRYSS